MILSIVICTYNRSYILRECLNSILPQLNENSELIVVDNGSTDNTKELCFNLKKDNTSFHYVFEPIVGLSKAKNKGALLANGKWVFYIDDDAVVAPNLVNRALYIINNNNFDCFGGTYYAWHYFKKPKWIPENFGTKPLLMESLGELTHKYLSGGIFAIKRSVLQDIGGFKDEFGMKGNKIGYGEEIYIQNLLRDCNYKIGFDPNLRMHHLVAKKKYKLKWHLTSKYKNGKVWYLTKGEVENKIEIKDALYITKEAISIFMKNVSKNGKKLITNNEYFWQNFVIDTLGILLFYVGKLNSILKKF